MKKLSFLVLLSVGAMVEGTHAAAILTLTEVSSTELDYSWSDGSGSGQLFAAPGSPDTWSGTITGPTFSNSAGLAGLRDQWFEPEGTLVNRVSVTTDRMGNWDLAFFDSDVPRSTTRPFAGPPLNNGDTFPLSGADDWTLKVVDLGDASAPVPEADSTALLLGIAFAGSAALRRRLAT
jgi:hypothetical protein